MIELGVHIQIVGSVQFLTPTAKPRLTACQLGWMERAWVAADEGRRGAVEYWIQRIERAIWPKGFDRETILRFANASETLDRVSQRIAARPVIAEGPIELPDRERGFAPDVVKHFDRTRTRLMNAAKDDSRDTLSRRLARIEQAPKEAAEKAALEAGIDESIALATARGEEVVIDAGALTISDRDGLRALYVDERLTEKQYQTAKWLRRCYEMREGDAGSQMGALGAGGSGHDNRRFVKARLARALATNFLGRLERRIAIRHAKRPQVLTVLRWVIGQGNSIRPLGGGRAYYRNIEALIEAIDMADELRKEDEEAKKSHPQPAA